MAFVTNAAAVCLRALKWRRGKGCEFQPTMTLTFPHLFLFVKFFFKQIFNKTLLSKSMSFVPSESFAALSLSAELHGIQKENSPLNFFFTPHHQTFPSLERYSDCCSQLCNPPADSRCMLIVAFKCKRKANTFSWK